MSKMDFRRVAEKLGGELAAQGYKWRLDTSHPHPRLVVSCNGEERFTPLSSTANYDGGDLLNMKRSDIKRDVLAFLPKPTLPTKQDSANGRVMNVTDVNLVDSDRVYPIRVWIASDTLCVAMEKNAIPEATPLASPMLVEDHLVLIFSDKTGIHASRMSPHAPHKLCYRFRRKDVPFDYAFAQPKGFKSPIISARRKGDSLRLDQPLPRELIFNTALVTDKKSAVPKRLPKSQYCLDDGAQLREMINDWLTWARAAGHDPHPSITDEGELAIRIVKRIETEL